VEHIQQAPKERFEYRRTKKELGLTPAGKNNGEPQKRLGTRIHQTKTQSCGLGSGRLGQVGHSRKKSLGGLESPTLGRR